MMTHLDALDSLNSVSAMRHLSAKDFEKMQKSQNEDFIKFFHSVATFVRRILNKKVT